MIHCVRMLRMVCLHLQEAFPKDEPNQTPEGGDAAVPEKSVFILCITSTPTMLHVIMTVMLLGLIIMIFYLQV